MVPFLPVRGPGLATDNDRNGHFSPSRLPATGDCSGPKAGIAQNSCLSYAIVPPALAPRGAKIFELRAMPLVLPSLAGGWKIVAQTDGWNGSRRWLRH